MQRRNFIKNSSITFLGINALGLLNVSGKNIFRKDPIKVNAQQFAKGGKTSTENTNFIYGTKYFVPPAYGNQIVETLKSFYGFDVELYGKQAILTRSSQICHFEVKIFISELNAYTIAIDHPHRPLFRQ